jgi:WhiB family transcriptional regulator, redox-sensing transcriptional regulator
MSRMDPTGAVGLSPCSVSSSPRLSYGGLTSAPVRPGFANDDRPKGSGAKMWITDWTARAACRNADPDALFVQGAAQNRAKLICRGCPVRTECLADALDNRIEFGVWGGMTERERRALLRRRPDVTSWRELLETAKEEYERVQDELVAS